ncbi:MAG: transporter substrate-binding domain-containing protein [Faecalibacterium sp.]|nr:transporter substrate-binding domain-containing protein [Faecalibacterium sp.]
MTNTKISRRSFLKAAGLTAVSAAALGLTTGCGTNKDQTDWEYIKDKGTLIIGMTIYPPMNYYDENNKLVGFDTEMAEAVCAKLGVTPKFQEIEWNSKVTELNAKNIDVIWNGMTVTEELGQSIDFSTAYSENVQVCVINTKNAATYTDIASINAAGVTVAAEAGSAGEDAAAENFPNAELLPVTAQRDCFMELKSGTVDVAVIDRTMAAASTGAGTSYEDLVTIDGLELTHEEFAVGLRKGSDLTALLNDTFAELVENGTVDAIAAKYPTVAVTL